MMIKKSFPPKRTRRAIVLEFRQDPVDMRPLEQWLNSQAKDLKGAKKKVPGNIKTIFHLVEHPQLVAFYEGDKYILHEEFGKREGLYKIFLDKDGRHLMTTKKNGQRIFLCAQAYWCISTEEKIRKYIDNLEKKDKDYDLT